MEDPLLLQRNSSDQGSVSRKAGTTCLESTQTRLLLNEAGGVFEAVGGGIWWYLAPVSDRVDLVYGNPSLSGS